MLKKVLYPSKIFSSSIENIDIVPTPRALKRWHFL